MRRSRIAVKPNIRAGGRSVNTGDEPLQPSTDGAITTEKAVRPAPCPQQSPPEEGPDEAGGTENAPTSPLEKASADLNNGVPSSGTTIPAAVPQRRIRISVTPKLAGPKATSTPRLLHRGTRSVPPTLPKEAPLQVPDAESQTPAPDNLPELNVSGSTNQGARKSCTTLTPSSPCLPSTSNLCNPLVHEKKSSVEQSPPSPQPGQVPQRCTNESLKLSTSAPDMLSAGGDLSCCDVQESPQKENASISDKEKILKALKLKELMKIERRKDIKKGKRATRRKQVYVSADHSKMTMGDLIYYLPNTSPMRNSTICEETEEETIDPPPCKIPEKTPEWEDEEEEDEEEEEMLMPKVRVAEDGSIVLDEESLTVRIQRTSTTKVVENSTALFERGSATTYRSFRNWNHVKTWSVRETDMFFLAISMVGTDFSLIGMLLPHRSRTEIKNKFKKEERTNSWRIDKAFKNKRPYDREFFSFLLEKVLAKDKEKGKSVKLVMTTPKKRRKAREKKAADDEECLDVFSEDEDFDMEGEEHMEAEKENKGLPNVNEADCSIPPKKKCKRTRTVGEAIDKEDCCEEQGNKKIKSKRTKKRKNEMPSSIDDAEGAKVGDDSVNAEKENEPDSSASAVKKKRKRSKKAEKDLQNGTSVEGSNRKRRKKSLKVNDTLEDSTDAYAEHSIASGDDSVTSTKKRRCSPKDDNKEEPSAIKKGTTRRKKSQKGKVTNKGPAEDGGATVAAEDGGATVAAEGGGATVDAEDEGITVAAGDGGVTEVGEDSESKKMDYIIPAKEKDKAQRRSSKNPKKPSPNLPKRSLKPSETQVTAEAKEEVQNSQNEENSKVIVEVVNVDTENLQKTAVVTLEKTPPRLTNLPSPSKVKHKSNEESEDPPASPAVGGRSSAQQLRKQRAERVKRSLTNEKKGKTKAVMGQDEPEHDPGVSAEDLRSQETDDESPLDENLIDFSCLHHLNSPMFQRKPMVVLSREDVSMILNVEDQTGEEDPSVSPLDLSLNTDLSFPLQCSNLLMEENAELATVESVVGEHGDAPQSTAIFGVNLEEKHCEDMGGWPGISTPADISALATDVCNQLNSTSIGASSLDCQELQVNPKMDENPVYTKSDALVCLEALSQGASMASQGEMVQSKTFTIENPESQEAHLATTEVLMKSQGSIKLTPEIKAGSQEPVLAASEALVRSRGSILVTPEIKEGSQEFALATPKVLISSWGSTPETPKIKELSRESALATSEVLTQGSIKVTQEIKEGSQESTLVNLGNEDNKDSNKDFQASFLATSQGTPTIKAIPEESSVASLHEEMKQGIMPRTARASEAEDLEKMVDKSCSWPLPTKQETAEQMMDNFEEICTPAKVIQPSRDVDHEEEPTFILTLYEIPVTEASSSNDTVMIPPLQFPDQPPVPSLRDSHTMKTGHVQKVCVDISQKKSSVVWHIPDESNGGSSVLGEKNAPGEELDQPIPTPETSLQTIRPQVKDEANDVSDVLKAELKVEQKEDSELVSLQTEAKDVFDFPKTESKSESEDDPGLARMEDLKPRHQSTPFPVKGSKCITPKSQDSEEAVSRLVLADVFVPVLELESDLTQVSTSCEESTKSTKTGSQTIIGDDKTTTKRRRAKIQVKPSLVDRRSVRKECPKLPQPNSASSQADTAQTTSLTEAEFKTNAETSIRLVKGDVTVKHDLDSSSTVRKGSLSTAHKVANVQPGHEDIPTTTASCSGSLDFGEVAEEDCEGVSHMVLVDVFVPVSEEMGHDLSQDGQVSIGSCPHEETLSLAEMPEVHFKKTKKEAKTKHVKQTRSKTGFSKTAQKQKADALKVVVSETEVGLEAKDESDSEATEGCLQILPKPCTVKVLRCTDSQPSDSEKIKEKTEEVSQVFLTDAFVLVPEEDGEDESMDLMSQQAETPSQPFTSSKKPDLKATKSKKKKSPAKNKGCKLWVKFPFTQQEFKNTKSSESGPPETEDSGLKLSQPPARTQQLRITSWVKQSHQSGTKDLSATSQMETSSLQAKEGSVLVSSENEDLQGRPQSAAPVDNEKTCAEVSHNVLLPASKDTEEPSTLTAKTCKESTEEPTVMKPHVTRRAKLQVKPTLLKRTRAKGKGDTSTSDQPQSSLPISPTRQCTRAAIAKKESDQTFEKPTEDVSKSSRKHKNIALPCVDVPTSSVSSPLTFSTSPLETSQQTPPVIAPKEGSRKSSDDTEDEPSKVSQFFLCDIFTEVEDGD